MTVTQGDLLEESTGQFLIQWKGEAVEEATWEEGFILRANFTSSELKTNLFFKRVAMLGPPNESVDPSGLSIPAAQYHVERVDMVEREGSCV